MKKNYFSFLGLILAFFLTTHLEAKVDPPNFNFKYQQFLPFMPNKSISDIEGKGKLIHSYKGHKLHRYLIDYQRYKFPVFVQSKNGVIEEMYAKLPSYFLHDLFHQALINRIKKQDVFFNKDEHSVYIWKNIDGNKHHYEAACTITCFPIFYNVVSKKALEQRGFNSISDLLEKSLHGTLGED